MDDAFIGEIRAFPYNYVPADWLACDGGTYPISNYQALFAVISNMYGGDGISKFSVPKLSGCTPIGAGQGKGLTNYPLGATGGQETVTLSQAQMPGHDHGFNEDFQKYALAKTAFTSAPVVNQSYVSRYLQPNFASSTTNTYLAFAAATQIPSVALASASLAQSAGGGGGHENRTPFTTFRYCICYDGEFPVPA